jgi:hypothetical protein
VVSGEEPATPTTSVSAKMVNAFVEPGEVFEEVRASHANYLNWLLPLLLSIGVGIALTMVVFAQPVVKQQLRDITDRALEKQIAAGIVTRQQADAQLKVAELFTGPVARSVQVVFGTVIQLFLVALVVWLLGMWAMKARFGYTKALEVTALAGMISLLGAVVTSLLIVVMGNMYMNPGPVLLVREFQPTNRTHLLLSMLNVLSFWHLAVLSLGLARLAGASWLKAFVWLFVLWALLGAVQFAAATLFGGM